MLKLRLFVVLFALMSLSGQNTTMDIVHVNNTAVTNTKLFIGKDFIISKSDPFWLYFDHKTKKVFEYDTKKNILKEMDLFDKIMTVNEIKEKVGKRNIKPIKDKVVHDFLCKGFEVTSFNEIPSKMKYYYTDLKNMSKNINLDVMNGFRKFNMKINPDDIELPKNTWPILVDVEKEVNGQKLYYTIEVIAVHDKFTDEAFVNKMKFLYKRAIKR